MQELLKRIERAELVAEAEAVLGSSPQRHWLVEALPPAYATGFHHSIGSLFGGDPEATAAYILDAWATRGAGLQWFFYPVEPAQPEAVDPILQRVLVQTREALLKRAAVETQGEVAEAMLRSILEQLDTWGFKNLHG